MTKHHGMTVSVNHAHVSIATTSATSTAVVAIAMAQPSSPGHSSGSEADGTVSSTALRRMYFKSARNAKGRVSSVPKVYTKFVVNNIFIRLVNEIINSCGEINRNTYNASLCLFI